ncbi:hypothetical protein [Brachybacterium sp.]|uniref:hypothetical protein n=1 Tax=Brachybacterium sp. TaxID=1891286 RepID=UPI002ED5121C
MSEPSRAALGAAGGDDPETAPSPRPGRDSSRRGPSRRGLSRRARRLLAVGSVLALVAAGLVGLPRLLGATDGPEQAAHEFLQAVIEGDLETVHAQSEEAPDASALALTAEILDGAEDRLESFEILGVEREAGTATVTAELRTGTTQREAVFTVTATDTGPFTPPDWELEPVPLPEVLIDVPLGAQEIAINGVNLPLSALNPSAQPYAPRAALQLLPGTYEITLANIPPWLEAPQLSLEVPPTFAVWRKPVRDLRFELDAAARKEVQSQVDAALEDCAASTSAAPAGCPFAAPGTAEQNGASPGRGTWTLTDPPRVGTASMDAFLWMVLGEGSARFHPDGSAPDADGIVVPFSLDAIAVLDGEGALEVHLRSPSSVSYGYCVDAETGVFSGVFLHHADSPDYTEQCD